MLLLSGLGGLPSSSAGGINGLPSSLSLGSSSFDSTSTTVAHPVSVTVPAAEAQVAVTPASTGRNKNKK